jgi:uncharacterized iron-regulated protein
MKNVLMSTAIVVAGLSMSACSTMENIGGGLGTQITSLMNTSTAQESSSYTHTEECFSDRQISYNTQMFEDNTIRRYYADGYTCDDYSNRTYKGQKHQELINECSKSREQWINELAEYKLYGGSLDGMTPEEGADAMISMCNVAL